MGYCVTTLLFSGVVFVAGCICSDGATRDGRRTRPPLAIPNPACRQPCDRASGRSCPCRNARLANAAMTSAAASSVNPFFALPVASFDRTDDGRSDEAAEQPARIHQSESAGQCVTGEPRRGKREDDRLNDEEHECGHAHAQVSAAGDACAAPTIPAAITTSPAHSIRRECRDSRAKRGSVAAPRRRRVAQRGQQPDRERREASRCADDARQEENHRVDGQLVAEVHEDREPDLRIARAAPNACPPCAPAPASCSAASVRSSARPVSGRATARCSDDPAAVSTRRMRAGSPECLRRRTAIASRGSLACRRAR